MKERGYLGTQTSEVDLQEFITGESSVEVEELESLIQSMGARESEPRKGTLPPHYQSVFYPIDLTRAIHLSQPLP